MQPKKETNVYRKVNDNADLHFQQKPDFSNSQLASDRHLFRDMNPVQRELVDEVFMDRALIVFVSEHKFKTARWL